MKMENHYLYFIYDIHFLLLYIGETRKPLGVRMRVHNSVEWWERVRLMRYSNLGAIGYSRKRVKYTQEVLINQNSSPHLRNKCHNDYHKPPNNPYYYLGPEYKKVHIDMDAMEWKEFPVLRKNSKANKKRNKKQNIKTIQSQRPIFVPEFTKTIININFT